MVFNYILLGVGIPLILIAAFLPPALLFAKVAGIYDAIPSNVKTQYDVVPKDFPPHLLLSMWLLSVCFMSNGVYLPLRILAVVIFLGILITQSRSRIGFYMTILKQKKTLPAALVTYSGYCIAGLVFATLGLAAMGLLFFSLASMPT